MSVYNDRTDIYYRNNVRVSLNEDFLRITYYIDEERRSQDLAVRVEHYFQLSATVDSQSPSTSSPDSERERAFQGKVDLPWGSSRDGRELYRGDGSRSPRRGRHRHTTAPTEPSRLRPRYC